jgi:hypothetical protein
MHKSEKGQTVAAPLTRRCFLRPRLLDFLSKNWEILKMNWLYYHESAQSFEWNLRGSPIHVRRLHYRPILEHLSIEDDLYQWRRSIAEVNNLNGYNAFVAEAAAQKQRTRRRGERINQQAHKDYLQTGTQKTSRKQSKL